MVNMKMKCGLRIAAWTLAAVVCALPVRAQESEIGGKTGSAPADLRNLVTNALSAARQQDEAKLKEIAHEMMIPNYEAWFKTTFGEERGTRMATAYGRNLEREERSIPWLFGLMAKKEGVLLVEDAREARNSGENWCAKALADTAKNDTAFYLVTLEQVQSDGTKRYSAAGHFTFVEGAYRRLDCFDLGLSAGPGHRIVGPLRVGGNVQAARIINRVHPVYPEEARNEGITGTVRLHVVLATDGTVKQVELVSGHPLLAQAAIDAVRQWRYQQTFLNGEPVEIDTTIDMIFSLNTRAAPNP
jgi:TonB family protein